MLQMKIRDASVRLIRGQPVFLFELRPIAACDHSPNTEFNPVLVLFRCRLGRRSDCCLAVAFTGSNSSGDKSPRKNQHKESARGGFHGVTSVSKQWGHVRAVRFFMAAS